LENAPILIIGDRLGYKLSGYKEYIATKISQNLSKNVKIVSLAAKGEALHRTIQKIKALKKIPLVTIYLGGSEEFFENKFQTKEIHTILQNFKRFNDDRLRTLMMMVPWTSRLIYEPIDYKILSKEVKRNNDVYSDTEIQKRNVVQFKLYEQELDELFSYLKDKGSYVFSLTQPLNYDSPPKKSCAGSLDEITAKRFEEAIELIKLKDFKKAYNITKDLALIANTNSKILYIHGQVAKSLGKIKESIRALEYSIALDCANWRGSPVYNKILQKVSAKNEVVLFDFNKYLIKEKENNLTFSDEIYPQSLFFEKVSDIISYRIKRLLKL
jgi:hypothetical protein